MRNAKIVLVAQWDGWCGACAVERPLVLTRSGKLGLRAWLTAPLAEPRPLTLTCRLCGDSGIIPSEQDDPPVLVEGDDVPTLEGLGMPLLAASGLPTAPPVFPSLTADVRPADAALAPGAVAPLIAVPAAGAPTGVAPAPVAVASVAVAPVAGAPVAVGPLAFAPFAAPGLLGVPSQAPSAPLPTTSGPELDQVRGRLGAALGALLAERTAQAGHVTLTASVLPRVPAVAAPALPLQRSGSSDGDSLATLQLLADGLDLLSSSRA